MKTAMQELLEEFDNMPEYLFYTYLKVKRDELLEKEKYQIIDAYSEGYGDGVQEPNPNDEYYEQTYN